MLRPARAPETVAQVVEIALRDIDAELADGVGHAQKG
jgi:hypothetical protein